MLSELKKKSKRSEVFQEEAGKEHHIANGKSVILFAFEENIDVDREIIKVSLHCYLKSSKVEFQC